MSFCPAERTISASSSSGRDTRRIWLRDAWGLPEGKRIQWTGNRSEMCLGHVQITAGCLQIGVAEQQLNRAQVRTGFQQMGSEAMPEGILALLMN